MSVIVDGSNGLIFNDASTQTTAATGFGYKNRIINGAMMIDQRNAGASVSPNTTSDVYPVDRFAMQASQNSKLTAQQVTTAPAGFKNSIKVTSSSAYTVGVNDYFNIYQKIEGYNVVDMALGTSNASTFTFSFWVQCSLTGTFGGCFFNNAFNRSYPFTYTISSANTWEQKTITIAGDQTGTWLTDNSTGLGFCFGLGVGTTYSGTAGAWVGSGKLSATGAVSVVGTSGATFYVTGVQLEKGSTATTFDYRPYSQELQLCYRYYEELALGSPTNGYLITAGAWGVGQVEGTLRFSVVKRTTPTMGYAGTLAFTKAGGGTTNAAPQFDNPSPYAALVYSNALSGFTVGQYARIGTTNSSSSVTASAEL